MTISNITNKILTYTLSGLGNNSASIIPMATKDTISNCAIVNTYRKEGTPDDVREKAIEEFGTGAVWLFGIPTLKEIINRTVYPAFGLDSTLDLRILKDKNKFKTIKESLKDNSAKKLNYQKQIFDSLKDKGKFLNKFKLPFTNEQLYKGVFYGKFALSTALCAFALNKIIKYKQKTTADRIKKDYYKNNASRILLNGNIKKHNPYNNQNKNEKNKNISFTSLSVLQNFMFNPVQNTKILDGVITATRLKEARHGERKEVALKEAFQLFFIYHIAKPIQTALEKLGDKAKLPIETDPKVIFDKNLKEKLNNSLGIISELKKSKNLTSDLLNLNPESEIADLLDKNGIIKLLKDKNHKVTGIDRLSFINEKDAFLTFEALEKLHKNIDSIKGIKIYKTLAILGNVAFAAWAMGVLQPKVNILMRKLLNNGDKSNPAIKAQEKNIIQQNKTEENLNPLRENKC